VKNIENIRKNTSGNDTSVMENIETRRMSGTGTIMKRQNAWKVDATGKKTRVLGKHGIA
jgi:hypothetical protein